MNENIDNSISNVPKITSKIKYKPAELHWDNVDLINKINDISDQIKDMVVTSENVKDVKKQLTFVRNYIKSNETKRKEIKAELLSPSKQLDDDVKTMLKPLENALKAKNEQVKQLDNNDRLIRAQKIKENIINPICNSRGLDPNSISVQHNWTNKSATSKSITEAVAAIADDEAAKKYRQNCTAHNGKIIDENGEDVGIEPKTLSITYFGNDKNITNYIMELAKNSNVLEIK